MKVLDFTRLPLPDAYGNYWFGKGSTMPAVFPIKDRKHPKCGEYMACPPEEVDVPFDGGRIRAFASPQEAAAFLARLCGKARRA